MPLGLRVPKVTKEILDHKDKKEIPLLRVPQVTKEIQGLKGAKDDIGVRG